MLLDGLLARLLLLTVSIFLINQNVFIRRLIKMHSFINVLVCLGCAICKVTSSYQINVVEVQYLTPNCTVKV